MKRLIASFALFLALVFCSLATAEAGAAMDQIQRRGVLIVGTSTDFPPLSFRTADGRIVGLEIDLANMMARAMNVNLEIVPMPFYELLPALEADELDMVLSAVTMTPERNLRVAFAGPYLISGQGILAAKDKVATVKEFEDMNHAGFRLAVAKGTTGEEVANDLLRNADIVVSDSLLEALQLLLVGDVDALLADDPFLAVAAHQFKDQGLTKSERPFTYEPFGVALPPHDPLLINWVQNFLNGVDKSGELKRMVRAWYRSIENVKMRKRQSEELRSEVPAGTVSGDGHRLAL